MYNLMQEQKRGQQIYQCKLKTFSWKENCCRQCRQVKFNGAMGTLPVQKQTQRTAQSTQNKTDLRRHVGTTKIQTFVLLITT